jgi:hypothetical protein
VPYKSDRQMSYMLDIIKPSTKAFVPGSTWRSRVHQG